MFRLDSASPPMLWQNGHLRPAVGAAFATMVMYFEERALAGDTHTHTSIRNVGNVGACAALQNYEPYN